MSQNTKNQSTAYPQFKVNQTPVFANRKRKRKPKKPFKRRNPEPGWI